MTDELSSAWEEYRKSCRRLELALTHWITEYVRATFPTATALTVEAEQGLDGWEVSVLDVLDIAGHSVVWTDSQPDYLEVYDEDLARSIEVNLRVIADISSHQPASTFLLAAP
jgi:predicted component of type VI protein secretion system